MKLKSIESGKAVKKTILALTGWLLMSLSGFSQSDTGTASSPGLILLKSQSFSRTASDTLVAIPKRLVVYMLQDLAQCDSDRVELQMQRKQNEDAQFLIKKQDDLITLLQNKNRNINVVYNDCTTQADSLGVEIIKLQKSHRKTLVARKIWSGIAIFISGMLILKLYETNSN